ncbi:FMN-binding split barrel-related protein [Niveomyces insectorum RCEF 264]|uniref:FMN-binding split barrel-related protein n=1 Tax=Niveomyces insectorum RCEF 264 TaxID=1081102 RepID=A0A167URM5_9HYPO|nr:FMN-binding split barrel-related protein [Niveomyces insectorum RCEF 264]
MKLLAALYATGATAAAVLDPRTVPVDDAAAVGYHHSGYHHNNNDNGHATSDNSAPFRIPTVYESAVLARRVLALTSFGTIATVFPGSSPSWTPHHAENRPDGLAGIPVGLPEYLAACEEDDPAHQGDPTLLAIRIATTFKNARAGSNVSLTLEWVPPPPPPPAAPQPAHKMSLRSRIQTWLGMGKGESAKHTKTPPAHAHVGYSAAALPRFALLGYLEPIAAGSSSSLATCFTAAHPDAHAWLPGNKGVHASTWERLVVTQVYWIGGFGDRAYIGWIPADTWRSVTRAEWEQARLPGEAALTAADGPVDGYEL